MRQVLFQPCHCRRAGCAYNASTGKCNDYKETCDKIEFFPGGCQKSQN